MKIIVWKLFFCNLSYPEMIGPIKDIDIYVEKKKNVYKKFNENKKFSITCRLITI
jgi:hypothetical protein